MKKLKILLAKGRIYEKVFTLFKDAGISISPVERTYFPLTNQEDLEFQVVKPQAIGILLANAKADIGFSGKDWIFENCVQDKVEEILDLNFDPVKVVAAIPEECDFENLILQKTTIASEYCTLSENWAKQKNLNAEIFRTWGTSEGFVRAEKNSVAQILIDNTASGTSLKANRLKIVDTLLKSSTRMYASKISLLNAEKKKKILELKTLFETVLNAREKVMLEMNCPKEKFEILVNALPSMKSPTICPLFGDSGFAIKIAVKKSEVPTLLPRLKELGATDILEYELRKVLE